MDRIEKKITAIIDQHRDEIIAFGNDIFDHAELGYKEYRTAEKFCEVLKKYKIPEIETGLAITGVKGYLKKEKQDLNLALIGELDALRIPKHPHVNPETQAAHSCGHNAQLTGVIGAAIALSDPEVKAALDGNVVFFAVPAEEYGEIEFKNQLKAQGKIRYGGGKCELIRIGAFDDIDLNIVHHSDYELAVGNGSSNGFVSKVYKYRGKEAHAACAPENGINALNAAALGLSALAYQRETFRDEDSVRVHAVMTNGGSLVNVVPGETVLEGLVRGKTAEVIAQTEKKVDRAFKGAAYALGAGLEIDTMPGYLPRIPNPANPSVVEAVKEAAPGKEVRLVPVTEHGAGSSDVGDLQHILPTLHFSTGGVSGEFHGSDFAISDEEEAYILTAKIFALSAYKLLKNGAAGAKDTISAYKPVFTKEEYIAFMEGMIRSENIPTG